MSDYVFGPVPSRRLGRSLGVDLVPLKTCSYDCIYCQLGRTTCKTMERKEWVPLEDVLQSLQRMLPTRPDYITLSGSGEPTLFSRIDELIERIKAMTDVPVAVLTNGSLLWQEGVRRQLTSADLVMPSLDAGDEAMFRLVNRPHEGISFERMLGGLVDFCGEFPGRCWLEVCLLGAHTALPGELAKLIRCVSRVSPQRVQLNTATRPPAESDAIAVSEARMHELAQQFDPPAEVISDFRHVEQRSEISMRREDIFNLLRRRPCTVEDIAEGLGVHPAEVLKYVEELTAEGLIRYTYAGGRLYYETARGTTSCKGQA